MPKFDEDDETLLTQMIHRAFYEQRNGNEKARNTQLRLIRTYYGGHVYRSVLCSLKNDRDFFDYRMRNHG